jgi:hypothetical protein
MQGRRSPSEAGGVLWVRDGCKLTRRCDERREENHTHLVVRKTTNTALDARATDLQHSSARDVQCKHMR